MVKPNKNNLGRSLVKSRFGSNHRKKTVDNGSMLHTTAVNDGYDWGRLNLKSVTEESSFQEFLSTAQLANTEFQAEKLNLKFVDLNNAFSMTAEKRAKAQKKHADSKHLLRVPRRPPWTREMSAEEVQENEREAFLNWRRNLSSIQEEEGFILTPYEKNLEFWRQLWRVLERSHILIQVVDARNPLLFRCEDLEEYAKEVGVKECLLLLNKADLLSEKQRSMWADYFDRHGVKVAFFSASLAAEKNSEEDSEYEDITEENEDSEEEKEVENESFKEEERVENVCSEKEKVENKHSKEERVENISPTEGVENENNDDKLLKAAEILENSVGKTAEKLSSLISKIEDLNLNKRKIIDKVECSEQQSSSEINKTKNVILDRDGLIQLLRNIDVPHSDRLVIGLVGYPNVGKSSTINALMDSKKVSVSATPGKTKHFQTLLLEDDLMLCDCPGLVLPSFVCTKADMVVNGILPIDHMLEYMDAVTLVTESLGGRIQAERRLGILLPPPPSNDTDSLPPRDVLNAYAYSRGMMTGMGTPDCARAARVILKAATKGLLPLAISPPDSDKAEYMAHLYPPLPEKNPEKKRQMTPKEELALKMDETSDDLDKKFFSGISFSAYKKGVHGKFHGLPTERTYNGTDNVEKPWKQINKHVNKNKKAKLRKVYAHLDRH